MLINCSKDARVNQGVADLVGLIVFATAVNKTSTFHGVLLWNFRNRIRQWKDNRVGIHKFNPLFLEDVLSGDSNEHITLNNCILKCSFDQHFIGKICNFLFELIHIIFPSFVDSSASIAHDDVLDTVVVQNMCDIDACGSCSIYNYFARLRLFWS